LLRHANGGASAFIRSSWPRPEPTIILEGTPAGRGQVAGAGENGLTIFIPSYSFVQQPNPAARPKLEEEQNDSLKGIAARGPRLGWMENRRARLQAQQYIVLSLGHGLDAPGVWAPTRARLRHHRCKLLRLPRLLDDRRDAQLAYLLHERRVVTLAGRNHDGGVSVQWTLTESAQELHTVHVRHL
jgi:hypothetical protein